MNYENAAAEIKIWGKELYDRKLLTARSGNISCRLDNGNIAITTHDSYLNFLTDDKIIEISPDGTAVSENLKKEPSTEKDIHLSIYRNFSEAKTIIHAHCPFTTAYFYHYPKLDTFSFESRFYLGDIPVIPQETPTVTDISPVIDALNNNSIAVLKNHGVIAFSKNFPSVFSLVDLLEEQSHVNLMLKGKPSVQPQNKVSDSETVMRPVTETVEMLSEAHGERLRELINNNAELQKISKTLDYTCTLAVKNTDTGRSLCFYYDKGFLLKTDSADTAEIIILGNTENLLKIFNRKIDPFVATTQGRVKTKGDFSKMSRWYPAMVKTFALWEYVPVRQ